MAIYWGFCPSNKLDGIEQEQAAFATDSPCDCLFLRVIFHWMEICFVKRRSTLADGFCDKQIIIQSMEE